MFFFTVLSLLQRKIALHSNNARAAAILFNGLAALITLSIVLFFRGGNDIRVPQNLMAWVLLFITVLTYGIYERERFVVAKLLDASVLTTVSNVSVFVAFFGSMLLYKEPLSLLRILGGLCIISALVVVSYTGKRVHISKKGLLISVGIFSALGIGWMLDKYGAVYFGSDLYSILVWTLPLVFILIPRRPFHELRKELHISSWRIFVLAGVNAIGYLLQLKALALTEATKVIPIVQTSTLFTVLLGIVLLGEREHVMRKIIAGIIAVAGVFLLVR